VISTEMTAEKIGRLIKKRAMTTAPQLAVSRETDLVGCDLGLLLFRFDFLHRPHALQPFDDNLLAGLEAATDNPHVAALGPQFNVAPRGKAVTANDVDEFDILVGGKRPFGNEQGLVRIARWDSHARK